MIYYKISAEDLFRLEKAAYQLDTAQMNTYDDDWLNGLSELEGMPSDEEIIEAINSCYEIIE